MKKSQERNSLDLSQNDHVSKHRDSVQPRKSFTVDNTQEKNKSIKEEYKGLIQKFMDDVGQSHGILFLLFNS